MSEVQFIHARAEDLDALVSIRILAMRESLVRIGRFDPARARERFANTFEPAGTWLILFAGQRVGFFVTKDLQETLLLDHLYVLPEWQGRGIGAHVLNRVFAEAQVRKLSVRVGALRDSESNRFYVRHGFKLVEQAEFDNYYVRNPLDAA